MKRDIEHQAVQYWNSPWSILSTWTNGRGLSARFFLDNDRLEMEVTVDGPAESIRAGADGSEAFLLGTDGAVYQRIPLPFPVIHTVPRTFAVNQGVALVGLRRRVTDGERL